MLNAATQSRSADGTLTPSSAVRLAWVSWITLGTLPMILFLYVVWHLAKLEPDHRTDAGQSWFIICSAYLLVVVPLSFFWRSRLFRGYWNGEPVRPASYLFGTISMWVALVIGGFGSLLGCLRSDSLMPDLLPALVAFMFFVTLWPSGRAMTKRVGHSEDPAVYEEPR